MKQGTIEIDCGENTCDGCMHLVAIGKNIIVCTAFNIFNSGCRRLPQCLATFTDKQGETNANSEKK